MDHDPAHLWALAVPGILTTLNGHDHTMLGGGPLSADARRSRTEALQRDWQVNNRGELLDMLGWLAREGHRKELNDICALDLALHQRLGKHGALEDIIDDPSVLQAVYFTRRHRDRISTRSLLAWDMARLISIAGWGYHAAWIREGEAWSYILAAAQAVQRSYTSWEELGQHHLLGRELWAGVWEGRFARCLLTLLQDASSPWRALPWNVDLHQPSQRIPLQEIVLAAPPPPGPVAKMRSPFDEGRSEDVSREEVSIDGSGEESVAPRAPAPGAGADPLERPPGATPARGLEVTIVIVALVLVALAGIGALAASGVLTTGQASSARPAASPPTTPRSTASTSPSTTSRPLPSTTSPKPGSPAPPKKR